MRQYGFQLASQIVVAMAVLCLFAGREGLAQSGASGNPLRQQQAKADPLTTKQSRLADRFDQLELLAGRLAELSRTTQPRRARLLRELVAKSREQDIPGRFARIVEALGGDNLGQASTDQVALQVDLQKLLDLLLQEDRDRQIDSERKRIRKYLAEVKRLIQLQRGIKARTDGGDDVDELSADQKRLAEETADLEQEIQASEVEASQDRKGQSPNRQGAPPTDPRPAESEEKSDPTDESRNSEQAQEGAPAESKDSPARPAEGKSQEEPSPAGQQPESAPEADGKPSGSSSPPGEGPSPTSPPGEAESSEQASSPAERSQQRLKKAQQRMQEALDRLKEAKQEKAVAKQEQALRELEQAKAELEQILRQLREEELERTLVLLEARFRKMLDAQVIVYEQTTKLYDSQSSVPEHEIEIASGRLDRQERQIIREADRALVLLREDGTTVAFPEAIQQARDDMLTVAKRLGEVKIGIITQGLEEDVIAVLEETLAALQQALKEARAKRSQPRQGSEGEPGAESLVDQLAELRMIRALQNRVNTRTQRYGAILGGEPAIENDLIEALEQLALRQERIFQATRDLESGRNK